MSPANLWRALAGAVAEWRTRRADRAARAARAALEAVERPWWAVAADEGRLR